jgi:uncharacterized membrane protein YedE/YeeE
MYILVGIFTGVLFSIGLSVSGMVNPNKVLGFLDIAGQWDPALIFVMAGGVLVNSILFKFILKRKNPLFGQSFSLPTSKDIDKRLIIGSALFGIGWGIGGICPGPGLANLFTLNPKVVVFVVFLVLGMFVFKWTDKLFSR